MGHDDFDFEPVKGLPAVLPEGEKMLWQGSPGFWGLAVRALHIRKVAFYFGVLMLWRFYSAMSGGQSLGSAFGYAAGLLPLAGAALAILGAIAWGYSRTTVYTLTSKRVVIRSGIALPITLNLPFTQLASASVKVFADGSGDIPLVPQEGQRIAMLVAWPHMKPMSFTNPIPMLRGVRDGAQVANLLAAALRGHEVAGQQISVRKTPGGAVTEPVSMGTAAHA